uniref:Uncharacterized protein n=1 Tax=Glossina austeni TaxID=7395 RepID=A0A1A9V984_GLOAU
MLLNSYLFSEFGGSRKSVYLFLYLHTVKFESSPAKLFNAADSLILNSDRRRTKLTKAAEAVATIMALEVVKGRGCSSCTSNPVKSQRCVISAEYRFQSSRNNAAQNDINTAKNTVLGLSMSRAPSACAIISHPILKGNDLQPGVLGRTSCNSFSNMFLKDSELQGVLLSLLLGMISNRNHLTREAGRQY